MAQVTITINSREYGIACEDGQELRIIQLAQILDEKAKALTGGNTQINEAMLLAMVALVLADELSELKKNGGNSQNYENNDVANKIKETDKNLAEEIKSLHKNLNLLAFELNLL